MVTVVMVAGALVGCGSQEVETTTTQDRVVSETTTEYGTENTSVEKATVEATVEESTEAATEEVSVDKAIEEASVETTEKTVDEQLAEATIIKEYRVYNKCAENDEKYVAYLVEGNQNDPSVFVSFKALNYEEEDLSQDIFCNDSKALLDFITSDYVSAYFEETSGDNTCLFFPNVSSDHVTEYNEDLGCYVQVFYTDEAEPEIAYYSFTFVEQ